MKGLEVTAAATLGISLLPFLGAWDMSGEAGRKYRATVKKFLYLSVALVTVPLGILSGVLARIGAPFDPRPLKSQKGLRSYCWRRNYQGRHYSGMSVQRTLNAVAS